MGGTQRGMRRRRKTVTEEQGARNENDKVIEKVGLFDWECLMRVMEERENNDLFSGCLFLVRADSSKITTMTRSRADSSEITTTITVCHQEDFHYINLPIKFTCSDFLPSIINCVGNGPMLWCNDQVYIFGNRSQPRIQHNHDVDIPIHKHTGASLFCIQGSGSDWDWKPYVNPNTNRRIVNLAVLSKKIYSFGAPFLYPQVYHHDRWNLLPFPEFPDYLRGDKRVSYPPLPDPLNRRIILHLPFTSTLCAFYPNENGGDGVWESLTSKFSTWNFIAVAIADNIIFFHPEDVFDTHDLIHAYDLNTFTWLLIEWDLINIYKFKIVYHDIFTLSKKGLMCLASGICGSSVQFLRFRFKRARDTHLKLTAIDYHNYDIPSSTRISGIISIAELELCQEDVPVMLEN